jgi:hypothetical protein
MDIVGYFYRDEDIRIQGRGLPNPPWFVIRGGGERWRLTTLRDRVSYITKTQTEIRVKLDRPAHPFQTTWSWDGLLGSEVGYALIGKGDDYEIIRFGGVTIDTDDPQLCTLTDCARGIGGTKAEAWGAVEGENDTLELGETSAITVTQLFMVAEPTGTQSGGNVADLINSAHVPLYVLMSTPDRGQNGAYDLVDGYRQGLGLPERWIDVASFESVSRMHNLPLLSAFWVGEQGKGKETIEELMKMAGLYFVERRFIDANGDVQYGIGIESIDLPVSSFYGRTLDDSQQVSGSRGMTTHNERLLVNNTKLKPLITWGAKDAKGEEIYHWDEWSIAEYGQSKQLEFKPSVVLGVFDNRSGGEAYRDREGQVAWAFEVSNRWFAAFGRGSYGGEIEVAAPYVYNIQIGDLIYVQLSTLRNSEGGPSLVAVGHVTKVEHRWGSRATGRVGWRSSIEEFCELAPVARATITSPTTMSVSPNIYTYASDRSPFSGGWAATDIQWFDTSVHGGNIQCKGWVVGNYAATVEEFTITSTNTSTDVLTCTSNLETLFGAGATIIFTFARWPNTTTGLSRQYAFVADEDGLDTTTPAKEYQ